MKQRIWLTAIVVFTVSALLLSACSFSVEVLSTPTIPPPTHTPIPATETPVPITFEIPSETPTLISIRDDTSSMLAVYDEYQLGDIVRGLSFSPDGTVLVAVGGNGNAVVHLWDVVNRRSLGTLDGHTNIVWDTAFSPNGQLLVTVSSDKTAKIWDWRNKALIKSLDFPGEVTRVAFSPDGQSLAVGGVAELQNQIQYASIWTFQIGSWQPLMRYNDFINITAMAFSPKGGTLIGGGTSRNVQVWKTGDASSTVFTLSHAHQVVEAVISSDGSTVITATCMNVINSDCTEGGIWRWDLPTGKLLMRVGGFPDMVQGLAFTADGSSLIAGSRDGTLRLFSTTDYTSRFQAISPGGLETLAISNDSGLLATGGVDGMVYLWKIVYNP